MINQELKQKAFEMRKNGESYNSISKKLHLHKSALSYWFKEIDWSKEIKNEKDKEILALSRERIIVMNKRRHELLAEKYKNAEKEAEGQFEKWKNEPLFVGALMLYLGEGDKSPITHNIRISNIDPAVLKIFIKFVVTYCNIPLEQVLFWLLAYPDLDVETCQNWWKEQLGIGLHSLYKAQVIQGKHKTRRLRYGVGNIIILSNSKVTKLKVLKWIQLLGEHLTRA